ncbi:MAG: hypothetical protein WA159_07560 [Variovorax sp.]
MPCTIVDALVTEVLGLMPCGPGIRAAAEGETRLGGRIPASTSGCLTSRGRPAYVTSLSNYVDLAEQLRGRRRAPVKGRCLGSSTVGWAATTPRSSTCWRP